jgi:hypothetical protein
MNTKSFFTQRISYRGLPCAGMSGIDCSRKSACAKNRSKKNVTGLLKMKEKY